MVAGKYGHIFGKSAFSRYGLYELSKLRNTRTRCLFFCQRSILRLVSTGLFMRCIFYLQCNGSREVRPHNRKAGFFGIQTLRTFQTSTNPNPIIEIPYLISRIKWLSKILPSLYSSIWIKNIHVGPFISLRKKKAIFLTAGEKKT